MGIEAQGDSFGYEFDVTENAYDPAAVFVSDSHGVRVVVERRWSKYLAGTEIDFRDGPDGRGSVFNNPNVARAEH